MHQMSQQMSHRPSHHPSYRASLCAGVLSVAALLTGARPVRAQTLQEFTPSPKGKAQVVVFASGNAKTVVAQPKDASSATGSLGVTFMGDNFIVSGVVNVPAKSDTVTAGQGASLLAPASGSTTSALLDVRWPTTLANFTSCGGFWTYLCKFGIHTYVGASGARWGFDPDVNGHPRSAEDVSAWATGVGLSYVFFDGVVGRTASDSGSRIGMALDLLGAFRALRGNIGMQSDSVRRERILGTKGTSFGGGEFGLNIRYNEANAALTYYHMAGSIRGFSGGQVVAAISFRAKLNGGTFVDIR